MKRLLLLIAVLVIPTLALADAGQEIKDGHRAAAKRYYDSFASGVKLSGSVDQNGSSGQFVAYSYGDRWLVCETFGQLDSFGYSSPDGYWTGSSYELPYMLDQQDNPASYVLNLLADGSYLDEPYWNDFNYVGEDAGGYNFNFAPAGLPPVKVVLYSDSDDPQYLQMMSAEIALSPGDIDSNTRRSFYHYTVDANGEVFTERETSRELSSGGETVNFAEYVVDSVEKLQAEPAELNVNLDRKPVGSKSSTITAPVTVPVDLSKDFFLVPLTFENGVTYHFILDTGASSSIFTPDAAKSAGIETSLSIPAFGHGSRADFELGLCTTASLGTSDMAPDTRAPLAGIPVAVISENNKELLAAMAFYGAGGILGVSVLQQYVATFDAENKNITFYPPQLFNTEQNVGRPNIEYWLDVEDLVYLKAKLNGTLEGDVVLDSGLQQDLALLRETVEKNGIELPKVDEREGMVVGGARNFDYVSVPSFELGPLGWNNILASLTDDSQGLQSARGLLGFIGVSLFFANKVTLDLFAQRMYLEPYGEPPTLPEGGSPEQPPADNGDGKTKLPVNIG
jgi:hypothetical protein